MRRRGLINLSMVVLCGPGILIAQEVRDASFTTRTGERVLRIETTLDVPKTEAWNAFTTSAGVQAWLAPLARVDLRTGGFIAAHYEPNGRIGDPGTAYTAILNYLDGEMLTLKIELNGSFAKSLVRQNANLQEIIQFVDLGNERCKIVSSMVGWGKGQEWNEAFEFYTRGNTMTYRQLANSFTRQIIQGGKKAITKN